MIMTEPRINKEAEHNNTGSEFSRNAKFTSHQIAPNSSHTERSKSKSKI